MWRSIHWPPQGTSTIWWFSRARGNDLDFPAQAGSEYKILHRRYRRSPFQGRGVIYLQRKPVIVSSPGFFAVFPWIYRERKRAGIEWALFFSSIFQLVFIWK